MKSNWKYRINLFSLRIPLVKRREEINKTSTMKLKMKMKMKTRTTWRKLALNQLIKIENNAKKKSKIVREEDLTASKSWILTMKIDEYKNILEITINLNKIHTY